MQVDAIDELFQRLGPGITFEVEEDPDDSDFFSVFAYSPGGLSGAELAGKVGERAVAYLLAATLTQYARSYRWATPAG